MMMIMMMIMMMMTLTIMMIMLFLLGKTIDNGKNGHKILKLAGNVGTDDIRKTA
jgi:hypothetical protein